MLSATQLPSDEELARQSQAGSLAAFEELVSRYERRLYSFVAQMCRNPADASDLTQEAFVQAFRSIHRFDCERNFAAWLFTIARRKFIDHHRARPVPDQEPMPDLADWRTPDQILSEREEGAGLWVLARRCLPPVQVQALWLRYVEAMSVSEVAAVLGKPVTYVKVLLFRSRLALGREMRAMGDTSSVSEAPEGPDLSPTPVNTPRFSSM